MNCTCIETVNRELADRNLELDIPNALSGDAHLAIATRWKDPNKRLQSQQPMKIAVSFCSFCGVKAGTPEAAIETP